MALCRGATTFKVSQQFLFLFMISNLIRYRIYASYTIFEPYFHQLGSQMCHRDKYIYFLKARDPSNGATVSGNLQSFSIVHMARIITRITFPENINSFVILETALGGQGSNQEFRVQIYQISCFPGTLSDTKVTQQPWFHSMFYLLIFSGSNFALVCSFYSEIRG